jgi:hypothetical protein
VSINGSAKAARAVCDNPATSVRRGVVVGVVIDDSGACAFVKRALLLRCFHKTVFAILALCNPVRFQQTRLRPIRGKARSFESTRIILAIIPKRKPSRVRANGARQKKSTTLALARLAGKYIFED